MKSSAVPITLTALLILAIAVTAVWTGVDLLADVEEKALTFDYHQTSDQSAKLILDAIQFQLALDQFSQTGDTAAYDNLLEKRELLFLRKEVASKLAQKILPTSIDRFAPIQQHLLQIEPLFSATDNLPEAIQRIKKIALAIEEDSRRITQFYKAQERIHLLAILTDFRHQAYLTITFLVIITLLTTLLIVLLFRQRSFSRELERTKEYLRRIIDVTPAMISVRDRAGRLHLVNKTFAQFCSTTVEESTGKRIQETCQSPALGQATHEEDLQILNSKTALSNRVVLIKKTEKNHIWLNRTRIPFIDQHTGRELLLCLETDITKVKNSQLELLRLRKILLDIINAMPSVLVVVDSSGLVIEWNKAATDTSGVSSEEAIGKQMDAIYPEFTKHMPVLQHVLKHGEIRQIYKSHQRKDNTDHFEKLILFPLINNKIIEGAGILISDITDQVRADEQLALSEKIISVGVLAGGIAHDFNNLLMSVLGNLNLARQHLHENSEADTLLVDAEKALLRSRSLTQRLLTFSRGGNPVQQPTDLEKLLRDAMDSILANSEIHCHYEIAPDLLPAYIDAGQIRQVFQNLALNATDAMQGQGTIHISGNNKEIKENETPQQQSSLQPGQYICLLFRDSGCGIDPAILTKIFDPYFTTKESRTGLGLPICHSIISKHGGQISVTSTPAEGTLFTLLLPAAAQTARQKETAVNDIPSGNATILLMDDDPDVRKVSQSMLEYMGYTVITANNGEEALATYAQKLSNGTPVSAVIMDLTIPGGMGGKEAVQKILEIDQQARVIVASGYSSDPIMADFEAYGFKAALNKPFTMKDLRHTLKTFLEKEGKEPAAN